MDNNSVSSSEIKQIYAGLINLQGRIDKVVERLQRTDEAVNLFLGTQEALNKTLDPFRTVIEVPLRNVF